MSYEKPTRPPSVCADCIHIVTYKKWGRYAPSGNPMCAKYTTTKIDPVSGNQVVDEVVDCDVRNHNGKCSGLETKPTIKRKLKVKKQNRLSRGLSYAVAYAKVIWKDIIIHEDR